MKFASSDIAKNILQKRYYRGTEKTPEELLHRVANAIAAAEESPQDWVDHFYAIMSDSKFLPNSPCLVNAGYDGGLYACFVLGIEDNLDSITKAKADAMAITKAGGGWGIGLSKLRAAGTPVSGSTHGIAGGPVGFWKTFSYDMRTMTQGGFRDAACMATMSIYHKDITDFIDAKSPKNSIKELLNLRLITTDPDSVAKELLKSETLAAAAETYLSNFNISVLIPDSFMWAYNDARATPMNEGEISQEEYLMNKIATGAWGNGEPGVLFIDTIRSRTKYDPESITATNPCGEQPLPPNGSCCLGSINLSEFVGDDALFDIDEFRRVIGIAVRFLDNMITLNNFPTEETREWSLENRSIGLGIMGYADALIKMGIVYGSERAIDFAEVVGSTLYATAEYTSKLLMVEKGPGTSGDFNGRRNNALLSIAPTGTISLLAGCSAGIEPIFAPITNRDDKTGSYVMEHPLSDMPTFVTLADIYWKAIIDTVAEFSAHIDTSISYTVNLPNSATVNDVKDVFVYAWETGCNGCTVYRDGSRHAQVLSVTTQDTSTPLKRPVSLNGKTFKYVGNIQGQSTNLYVTVNSNNDRPWEVFVNTPNIKSLTELQLVTAVTRLSSLALRVGAPVQKIVDQLRKIEGQSVTSVPALIARALSEYNGEEAGECPECGGSMVYQGGCATCGKCGYSRCG